MYQQWLIVKRVSGDEEMNIILLRLFEYLGHANPFISGIAYTGVGLRFFLADISLLSTDSY